MLKVTAKFRFVDPGGEAGDIVLAKGELLSLPNVLKVPLAPQPATPTLKSCVINHMCVVGQSPAKNCLHQTKLFSKNPPRATTYVIYPWVCLCIHPEGIHGLIEEFRSALQGLSPVE